MSSIIADYTSGADLLEGLHAFLTKGHTLRPTFTGTGNGYCDDAIGTASSVFEIITLTFTADTLFNVSGSVSGAMGTGSTGTLFTHARFQCTINVGTVAWVTGDTITWTMTAPWSILSYVAGQAYIYQAPGNDNNSEINIGMTVKSNSSGGYYGARVGVYPVWVSSSYQYKPCTFPWWPLGLYSGSNCRLFIVADGNSFYAVCRVGTYYMAAGGGFTDTIVTKDRQPAPYWVGGSVSWPAEPTDTASGWRYDVAPIGAPMYPEIVRTPSGNETVLNTGGSTAYFRNNMNYWLLLNRPTVGWSATVPRGTVGTKLKLGPCLDGSLPLWPIYVQSCPYGATGGLVGNPTDSSTVPYVKEHHGYIPFAYYTSAYDLSGSLLVAESSFRDAKSRSKMLIMQPGANSTASYLYAMEMF